VRVVAKAKGQAYPVLDRLVFGTGVISLPQLPLGVYRVRATFLGNSPSFPGYDPLPGGSADDMQSQFKFTLSRFDRATGTLWETEHGPQGGDELNVIEKGKNYGWPVIGYGANYTLGTEIHAARNKEGMEQPKAFFVPSIGISGLMLYTGDKFPNWKGNLFTGGMAGNYRQLVRFSINGNVRVEGPSIPATPGPRVALRPTNPNGLSSPLLPLNTDGTFDSTFVCTNGPSTGGGFNWVSYDPRGYIYLTRDSSGGTFQGQAFGFGPYRLFAGIKTATASGFDSWAAQFTFPPGKNNPQDDADGDGIANIFEFYFGSNPTNGASGAKPSEITVNSGGQNYPAITFIRSKSANGVTLIPQASASLSFGSLIPTTVESVVDLGNGTEQVTIRSTTLRVASSYSCTFRGVSPFFASRM